MRTHIAETLAFDVFSNEISMAADHLEKLAFGLTITSGENEWGERWLF